MMEPVAMKDLEELTVCGYCKQKFNDVEMVPKLLSCKHYFCLNCVQSMMKGHEVFCVNCWKRTELAEQGPETLQTYSPILTLCNNFATIKIGANGHAKPPDKDRKLVPSENCHTHGMPLALWCHTCCAAICRACATQAEHPSHQIKSQNEAKEQLASEVQLELLAVGKMLGEVQRLAMQQRQFLLKVLEACITLKTHVETDLQNGWLHMPEVNEARETLAKARVGLAHLENPGEAQALFTSLSLEKQRLQAKYQEMFLQCQLDDLIGNSGVVFDFALLKQAVSNIHALDSPVNQPANRNHVAATHNPILFLANYCMSQLYSRHVLSKQQQQQQHLQHNGTVEYVVKQQQVLTQTQAPQVQAPPPQYVQEPMGAMVAVQTAPQPQVVTLNVRPPSSQFLYFFNIDVNGTPHGRMVIETRPDAAPKMAKNFAVLTTGEMGYCYKGCAIFQCWEGESVITGDFELNNGRGGRSIYEEGYFMPDDTKFPAVRGAVGMRRTQKRHDNLGMVGSQFRVILQEMRGFTAIFGHVVEGLDLVEKIATFGDQTGKPTKTVVITNCGKL
ncbi:uncharacterized protein LOC111043699 [Nilaparvata lugens]|uniref:uncharacterized protein LOC111043699 n=1 Tax=Nilaparvata lugens TaxID=108931 RepID=UPI000B994D00|nr:uncharacterized protein LOC111043699 [Nilaparvata lugens]XP_022184411.1 uncharacterized protein LOC111043699 [Nilaparvata lugens]